MTDETKRWHVVCHPRHLKLYPEGNNPERDAAAVWTVSTDPDECGWETDSAMEGYGLTRGDAIFLADAANERMTKAIQHAGCLASAVERLLRADRSILDAEEWLNLHRLLHEFRKRERRAGSSRAEVAEVEREILTKDDKMCDVCNNTGYVTSTITDVQVSEPCSNCLELEICPMCGEKSIEWDADDYAYCNNCSWKEQ